MHVGERFKGRLKTAARQLAETGPRRDDPCSVILTYHSVGCRDHEMNVTPQAFCDQMAWLAEHVAVVSLAESATEFNGIAITFDDGFRDNLTNAAPILRDYGLSATVFVVAGRTGMRLSHGASDDDEALCTWDELLQLRAYGWTLGAHTLSHRRLSTLDVSSQRREIVCSKELIERHTGETVEAFAYPFGSSLDFTEETRRIVREAGYRLSVSNRYGVNRPGADPWALRRIWIDRSDTMDSFIAKVEGRLDRLSWLDSPIGIRTRRLMNGLLKAG